MKLKRYQIQNIYTVSCRTNTVTYSKIIIIIIKDAARNQLYTHSM